MTNQQLKDTIQGALRALPVGGRAGTLDELIVEVSKRGPSGTYHAGELARVWCVRRSPSPLSSAIPCPRARMPQRRGHSDDRQHLRPHVSRRRNGSGWGST
jgi:hypothetical protein